MVRMGAKVVPRASQDVNSGLTLRDIDMLFEMNAATASPRIRGSLAKFYSREFSLGHGQDIS